jgi:hypothetical protein
MDREGLVLNCQTGVTTNDSLRAVQCSVLCFICKPTPSYTKIHNTYLITHVLALK